MIVTINGVSTNVTRTSANGKTYVAHVVKYTNGDGKTLEKLIFPDNPIAGELIKFTSGDNADITARRNGKFFEWVAIAKTDQAPTKSTGGRRPYTSKSTFDQLGAKIGNISNCAASIYSAKLTGSLKEAVDIVLDSHAYIETKLKDTTVAPSATKETKAKADLSDLEDASVWEIPDNEGEAF